MSVLWTPGQSTLDARRELDAGSECSELIWTPGRITPDTGPESSGRWVGVLQRSRFGRRFSVLGTAGQNPLGVKSTLGARSEYPDRRARVLWTPSWNLLNAGSLCRARVFWTPSHSTQGRLLRVLWTPGQEYSGRGATAGRQARVLGTTLDAGSEYSRRRARVLGTLDQRTPDVKSNLHSGPENPGRRVRVVGTPSPNTLDAGSEYTDSRSDHGMRLAPAQKIHPSDEHGGMCVSVFVSVCV